MLIPQEQLLSARRTKVVRQYIILPYAKYKQWGYGMTNGSDGTLTVTLPISATVLEGVASDGGTTPGFYAFYAGNPPIIYGRNASSSGAIVMGGLCRWIAMTKSA